MNRLKTQLGGWITAGFVLFRYGFLRKLSKIVGYD